MSEETPKPDWRALAKDRTHLIGADECGWGSWAGPLVVCAAAVPSVWTPPRGVVDSKKLSKKEHERLYYILKDVVPFEIVMASAKEIDTEGAGPCLKRCFHKAVTTLLGRFSDALVIIDGNVNIRNMGVDHLNFPEADLTVPAVSAASILGKFTHDRHMLKLAQEHPGYGFETNVGYHSDKHVAGIEKKGLCPEHRRSYVPTDKLKTAEAIAQADDEGMVVDE